MCFFAEADKQTNQKTAAFSPCGWELAECVQAVHRFSHQGEKLASRVPSLEIGERASGLSEPAAGSKKVSP